MVGIMFCVPLYRYEVPDWINKKKSIKNVLSKFPLDNPLIEGSPHQDFIKYNGSPPYKDSLLHELDDAINLFSKEIKLNREELLIENIWNQRYEKYEGHGLHNHASHHYSSILYLDFDSLEHKPTKFYAPFENLITGDHMSYSEDRTKEGDIVFFPSRLLHEVPISYSNKPRSIISFNIDIPSLVDKVDQLQPNKE
jgi:hypothetical protein